MPQGVVRGFLGVAAQQGTPHPLRGASPWPESEPGSACPASLPQVTPGAVQRAPTGTAQGAALPGLASRPLQVLRFSTKPDLKFSVFDGFPKAPPEGGGRRPVSQNAVLAASPPGLCGVRKQTLLVCSSRCWPSMLGEVTAPRSGAGVSARARCPAALRCRAGSGGLAGGAVGSAAALRAAPSVVCAPWAGEPLPLPLPLLPAGGDRTKRRDVAERAGEARGGRPAAAALCGAGSGCPPGCGAGPGWPLSLPAAAERPAGVGARAWARSTER